MYLIPCRLPGASGHCISDPWGIFFLQIFSFFILSHISFSCPEELSHLWAILWWPALWVRAGWQLMAFPESVDWSQSCAFMLCSVWTATCWTACQGSRLACAPLVMLLTCCVSCCEPEVQPEVASAPLNSALQWKLFSETVLERLWMRADWWLPLKSRWQTQCEEGSSCVSQPGCVLRL